MARLRFTSSEATNTDLCFPKKGSQTQIHYIIGLIGFIQYTQRCHYNVVITSLSNVALTSPYSCDGNVGQRCQNEVVALSYRGVIVRRCNDVVFATASDDSTATI